MFKINSDLAIGNTGKSLNTLNTEVETLKPVLLYSSNGTNTTADLSDSAANYTYLEIFYRDYDKHYGSVKVYEPNNKMVWAVAGYINDNLNGGNLKFGKFTITDSQIKRTRTCQMDSGSTAYMNCSYLYIVRVLGYK